MSVFRLQTFAPAGARVTPKAGERDPRHDALVEESFRNGFLAGQAAAMESFLEDQARLSGELIEALSDARMTNEAARRHVAASLAPVVEALFSALTPSLLEAGTTREVVGLVERALEDAPNARPRLRCAPELAGPVRALLAERGIEAKVEEAPELLPREAQVFWDQGYDHLDLDACVAHIRECLAIHLHQTVEVGPEALLRHG